MIRRLLYRSNPAARRLLLLELAGVTVVAVLQGVAFLLLVPLLRELLHGDTAAAGRWLAVLAGVWAATTAVHWATSQIAMRANTELLTSLLDGLGDRLVRLPLSWYGPDRTGLVTGIAAQGAMFVSTAPYTVLRPLISGFVTPGTVLLGMYLVDVRLAVAMTVMVPVLALAYRWVRRAVARGDATHAEAVADTSNRVVELARTQAALRTAGEGSVADRLIDEALHQQHHAYRELLRGGGAGIAAFTAVVQVSVAVVLVTGAYLAAGGHADVATVIALLVLGLRFNEPIVAAGDLGGGVAVARTTLDQLDALDAVAVLPEPDVPAVPDGHDVEFRDVTFGYGGPPVLRGLSFTAPAGSMTAVVGPSGSGKTTITRLVARLHDPESGTVTIGGVPLPQLGTDAVEAAVAPVFQDVYLFDDTVLANVWIGNPDLPREQVLAAAVRARVDEIAARLPGGWDARVGEGGSTLSGGERQRISIARALLKDAPVLLLDEATSALDVGNERAIGEAVEAARAGRTLIVVAHRLQTVMSADRILMLDGEGGIRESGTHAELLAAGGEYARYWNERVEAAGWRLASRGGAARDEER